SIEAGWKLSSADKWYAEPQAQLQYTRIGRSDYKTSNDVKIENSSVDSLIGRAGLRLGRDLERMGGEKMNLYVRADIPHEFKGEQTFCMQGHHDLTPLRYEFTGDATLVRRRSRASVNGQRKRDCLATTLRRDTPRI
ncbi:autotransporter outer membrane beta-barrel domain-containing protein, partial [Sutterella seckii]